MPIDTVSMDALLAKMNAIRETMPRVGAAAAEKGAAPRHRTSRRR